MQGWRQCLVQGGSRGIGLEFVKRLLALSHVDTVVATCRRPDESEDLQELQRQNSDRLHLYPLDLTSAASIKTAGETIRGEHQAPFHLVLNCAGFLHSAADRHLPEKSLPELDYQFMLRNFQKSIDRMPEMIPHSPALLASSLLKHDEHAILASISARIGSISDNRLGGWYSYRASKAAQNQFAVTLSHEFRRTHPNVTVLQMHPGTVATDLSKPFQSNVKSEKLFTTEFAVGQLLSNVLNRAEDPKEFSGRFYAWSVL
ncbi:uncharacterized protein MONBRDRAFT_11730 [Monosiga brevicollis MX1]|uniref:Uncharacterized protein n=1 Tax=Monosiga brevicollis TaxID=81824 RepID=A9VA45_MONBE|nr:uncharacterized protein MONBRDRAFT_11730 [Monosiga brevicollis MX1]EDQ85664.1 predicted protein [Monosiga brevicollis MX1]|eukprot:XP_001749613.1 hypothetical protein [Monosiga brevicollis MX1]